MNAAGPDTTANDHNLAGAFTCAPADNPGALGLTDHPIRVGDLRLAGRAATIWADRPARNLVRIMLVDEGSRACGDALAQDGTRTIAVPETWPPPIRAAAIQLLHTLLDRMAAGPPVLGDENVPARTPNP
ncbi:hypothetical protein DFJ67_6977 [Asanoa ferruginea]|uniref:Uncharacterized protein n=1 Tax=Asanoa ferruginea TaxID=53367 RepID=A0A3D9ZU42_9ACTN|nr:hypothetical protein [Asanoa ferruginea]REG00917.1 hypothetical protein DFJ67_6977 [Asanoa ferruginea]GIF47500.1 hypothetical protein Afe04nite_20390 [Asanoa ferruginea]